MNRTKKATPNKEYFKWLYGKIKGASRSYTLLCAYLDTIEFVWTVPNDGNREQDAMRQRELFLNDDGFGYHSDDIDRFYDEFISVFEVLVALCERIEFNLDDMEHEPRQSEWFEELLHNLNISWAVDDEFKYRLGVIGDVDQAIDIWMHRQYDFNGNGSLFPLRNRPKKHMAKTEMWYQMMQYLDENY